MTFHTVLFSELGEVARSMFDRIKVLSDRNGVSLTKLALMMDWAEKSIFSWKKSNPSINKVKKC